MHGENFLVNNSCDWQAIEAIGKRLPEFNVISSLALVVKSVDTVDWSTLVIPTKNEEILWILDFVCKEQADGLQRLFASIDIIAEEKIIGFGRESSVFEKAE